MRTPSDPPRLRRRAAGALLASFVLVAACGDAEKKSRDEERDDDDDATKDERKPKKSKKKAKPGASAEPSPTTAPTPEATAKTAEPVPPPASNAPPALAVGQWVRYESADPQKATVEYRITRLEGDGSFVVEVDESAVGGASLTELVVDLKDRSTTDAIVVKKARVKTATGVVTVPESGVRTSMKRMLKDLVLRPLEGDRRSDVTTRAGAFPGCFVREIEEDVLGSKLRATAYYHPSVPINGFVKYDGKLDAAPATKELVAFGLTGAQAKF